MLMYLQLSSIVLKLVHINMKIRTYGNIVVQITKITIILFPFTFPFPLVPKEKRVLSSRSSILKIYVIT
uniref:Putative ovule protein n=1 Tax=Solanum chacoense TaxID=4108 RepID=A0A0V0GX28_SOLCH